MTQAVHLENPLRLRPDNNVSEGLHQALVETLGVDDDQITLRASLSKDLGAEKCDMLHLTFILGRIFKVNVERHDLYPNDIFLDDNFRAIDGFINTAGIQTIRERMPFADLTSFEQDSHPRRFADHVQTVGFLMGLLEHRGIKFLSALAEVET